MARLRYNGVKAELSGSHTDSVTTITLAAALTHAGGTNVPTIVSGDYIPLSILDSDGVLAEIVHLTAYTAGATTGTITRGREGTAGVAHASGASVTLPALDSYWYADPMDDPTEWGADLGYDEEFNKGGATALPSGWSWLDQGTATYARTKGRGIITEPTAASGNQLRCIQRAIPTEGSYEAVFKLNGRMFPAGNFGFFAFLRDSVGGKIVAHGRGSSPQSFDLWNWNSTTALSAVVDNIANDASMAMNYWKIKKNSATSWDFEASPDGATWNVVRAAHNVQTFLGTAPTHIGFGLWRNNLTLPVACDWFRVR